MGVISIFHKLRNLSFRRKAAESLRLKLLIWKQRHIGKTRLVSGTKECLRKRILTIVCLLFPIYFALL